MDRIHLPPSARDGARFVVRGAERRHLGSLRVRPGERFLATDGEGREFLLEARVVSRGEVSAEILEAREVPRGPGAAVTIAIAPPKGTRMEIAVEKVAECGVGRIVPIETQRSVVRARGESERVARWRRIACSATAQSGGAWAPGIAAFVPLDELLADEASGRGPILLAHPGDAARPVAAALTGVPASAPVLLLVGPEGGFTEEEVDRARRRGAVAISLGSTRLRTETAAVVAVALTLAAREGRTEEDP